MTGFSRKTLIGCGLLVLIGGCVAIVLTISGVGAITAIFTPDPEGLTLEIGVQPPIVLQGEPFDLVITAGNEGTRPLLISEITLPQTLLAGVLVTQVTPPELGRSQAGDSTSYRFSQTVGPGERVQITLTLLALTPGDFSGELAVVVGVRRKLAPLRVVVEAAAEPEPTPIVDQGPVTAEIPYQAVVQILTLYEEDGELYEGWTGSGTIVSQDGLILTNAHVVLPDKYYPVDGLVVSLTEREDGPPVPRFFAEVLQADEELDIAVIRVTSDINGNEVDPGSLDLPVVPLGDSNQLRLGDRMYILGYPGIGGDTITLTRGEVSGFTAEEGRGERAFIKTSATIAGGNSGGLAANERGELIGVPTQLGYGGDEQFIDCRVLADTNRDGVVNEDDNCVPTGGFINALRPLELALPLIEAAHRGEVAIHAGTEHEIETPQGGQILLEDDFSDPNSGWETYAEEDFSVGYQDETYQIAVDVDNYLVWRVAGERFADIVATVEAQPVQSTSEGDFGLVCRYQDGENFYALEISEDGYYTIWKREAGEFVFLVDWETSSQIPQDGSRVTLKAACVGDILTLIVNDMVLAEVMDSTFSDGDVGLIVGTWEMVGLVVAFDNLVVQEP